MSDPGARPDKPRSAAYPTIGGKRALTLRLDRQANVWRIRLGLALSPDDDAEVCWLPVACAEEVAKTLAEFARLASERNGAFREAGG